ncbi:MAG TPA: glucose 1-dehydrogenase [Streptosporangiaceae bacterium]|nr:glucose 1-dehydrogenase [Streptosporangiaceae bacterium]
MGRLDGKIALISGGARGMGKSHARHFVAEGAKVVIGDLLDDKGKALAAELGAANCRYIHHDVTSEADWAAAVGAAADAFGALNVLVNNAGILKNSRIADMSLADFRQVIDVNLIGEWLGIKSVIAPMTDAGGGSIINISSVEGFTGAAGMSAYSASKFGVRGITRSAAQELGKVGIRVNSVHPGGIITTMTATAFESFTDISDGEGFMRSLPIPRFAKSAEVSPLVVFLASDESSYCTGSEFVVDGGMLSGPGY